MVTALTPNRYGQPVSFLRQNPSQSYSNSPSSTVPDTVKDTVTISPKGKLSLLGRKLPLQEKSSVSVRSMNEDFLNATSYAEARLKTLYRQIGISPSAQMKISVGYDGQILVTGETPKSDTLAQEINANEKLSNTIRGMSAMASLLEAINRHQEFSAAYEKNPAAAVDRYGYLFEDGHEYHVSFTVEDGHIDTKIEYI